MKLPIGLKACTYREMIKRLMPVLNIILCSSFVFVFLVVSYNLILGDSGDASFNIKSEAKNENKENVQALEENEIVEEADTSKEAAKEEKSSGEVSGISKVKAADLSVGTVKVYITSSGSITELPLEEYIKGVVASEMPLNFNKEALKAQAVAARTYTVARLAQAGGKGCQEAEGADLCDTVHCQVYTSKEEKIKQMGSAGEAKWKLVEDAVNETKGMVMTYNGYLISNAFYFSTSSGHTENCQDVFSSDIPYLKSVDSPGEEGAPRYTDRKSFDFARAAEIINGAYKDAVVSPWNLKDEMKILSHTDGGAVKEIKTGAVTMSGVRFRKLFGLNSANFTMEFLDNEMVVDCVGFGHGVGMSQWGANAMAEKGSGFEDILKHYYTGIGIDKVKEE